MGQHDRDTGSNNHHQEVWDLLPWYANDALDQHEREKVDRHLKICTRCQEEMARCQQIATTIRRAENIPESSATEQFAKLMTRIETVEGYSHPENDHRHRSSFGMSGLHNLLERTTWGVRWVLAAQGALILLLSGVLVWQTSFISEPLYQTLSSPVSPAAQAAMQMRVIFAAETEESEIRKLLLDIGGRIVNGPSPIGAYTVEVPLSGISPQLADTLPHQVRAHPKVILAEFIH